MLENLRQRFEAGHIYTYVGSILIAVNPFKFHPIYNPKYVRLYQNQRVGPILPPHIFAIADNAYYCMLKEKRNQVIFFNLKYADSLFKIVSYSAWSLAAKVDLEKPKVPIFYYIT